MKGVTLGFGAASRVYAAIARVLEGEQKQKAQIRRRHFDEKTGIFETVAVAFFFASVVAFYSVGAVIFIYEAF